MRVAWILVATLSARGWCLAQAAKDTQKLLKEVAVDQAAADDVKQRVSKEEVLVGQIAREATEIAADAKRDLDEAMPAYNSAVEALKSLEKKDVQEVKSYAKPPELVQVRSRRSLLTISAIISYDLGDPHTRSRRFSHAISCRR